jgi:N4-gp56 family major capsid protein
MAISNSTTLNDLVGQIVSADAQSAAYAARVMRPLVRSTALPPGAGSIVVPRFQELTVAALTEGVAPSSTTWSSDGVTLTPTERGVYVQISKRALHSDPFSDLAPYGDQMGRALAADEDSLILDAFTTDTTDAVNDQSGGADNVVLADFLTAIGELEAANAPQPYYAVFHPVSWAKIRAGLDASNVIAFSEVGKRLAEGMGEGSPNMNAFVGAPYGIPAFISTGVNTFNGAGVADDSYLNYMFAKEAMGYGYIQDIGVDVDDNVTARAFDLMGWYSGHASELVDTYAVAIEDDVNG